MSGARKRHAEHVEVRVRTMVGEWWEVRWTYPGGLARSYFDDRAEAREVASEMRSGNPNDSVRIVHVRRYLVRP